MSKLFENLKQLVLYRSLQERISVRHDKIYSLYHFPSNFR